MNKIKKVIAVLLSVVMIFSIGVIDSGNVKEVSANTAFAITTPTAGSLKAAGYIDIKWTAAVSGSKLANYQVYINGKLVKTTTGTSYEYYTTKVNYHTVFVKANFKDGTYMSTSNVRFGVTKKGLAADSSMGRNVAPYELNAAWYYNWRVEPNTYPGYSSAEFVPMVWKETDANNLKNSVNQFKSQGYKYVLTFNEPDLRGQCDMPVNDVYNVWQGIDDITGIKVSSPAIAFFESRPKPGRPAPSSWLSRFIEKIDVNNDHEVDFISIHCYPDNFQGEAMAKWFVSDVVDWTWERYKKPIWITEFSTSGNVITEAGTRQFIEAALPELDKRDYVERYSFFSFDKAKFEGGLWWYGSGALSTAGEAYARFGNPTTDLVEGNVKNPGTKIVTIKKPARSVIKSAKNIKKRKIKITLKKIKQAKGYQIRWCDSRKFSGYWQKNTTKFKYTIKGLDKKTRYYIKVRAYVFKNNKKLYGPWSKIKRVMVKR